VSPTAGVARTCGRSNSGARRCAIRTSRSRTGWPRSSSLRRSMRWATLSGCRCDPSRVARTPSSPRVRESAELRRCGRRCAVRHGRRGGGFSAVKFHGSGHPDIDREVIRAVRSDIGPALGLMWDGSCAYSLEDATAVGRELAQQDALCFEAPMPDESGPALVFSRLESRCPSCRMAWSTGRRAISSRTPVMASGARSVSTSRARRRWHAHCNLFGSQRFSAFLPRYRATGFRSPDTPTCS
jgi:hypothetical protein